MGMPVQTLPVLQNWDCQGCSNCCRTYQVNVSLAEREKIESQNWAEDPAMAGVETVVWDKQTGSYRLNHREDGSCVFLNENNQCRIHGKFGSAAKPMACRIYPFVFTPVGNQWQIGIRFACPSAAKNEGRPFASHIDDLDEYSRLLELNTPPELADSMPPRLGPEQMVPWSDLLRFVDSADQLLAYEEFSVERRLRGLLSFMQVCRNARYEKLSGKRLSEFLEVIRFAALDEVPADPWSVTKPGWVGRTLFRQIAAIYCRKDNGPDAGIAKRGRLTRIRAAWRFALGSGSVPKLHGAMPDVSFADAEKSSGRFSPEAEELLTRYYRVKVGSVQFCGAPNYQYMFWEGLASLVLTFPIISWLARVLAGPRTDQTPVSLDQVRLAVQIVDDNFGFNQLLGTGRQRWATRTLLERGELDRLVAWYGR